VYPLTLTIPQKAADFHPVPVVQTIASDFDALRCRSHL
jgi:hypothetical protein